MEVIEVTMVRLVLAGHRLLQGAAKVLRPLGDGDGASRPAADRAP